MKQIVLGKGEITLVDDCDFDRLNQYRWNKSQYGYAYRLGNRGKGEKWKVLMHREIMNPSDVQIIDHKNGDRLDNRRNNLRIVTISQNVTNCSGRGGSSGYKGVFLNKSSKTPSWRALIKAAGKPIHLGCFKTKEEAAMAYNKAALKYHGEFARLNIV